ncbi:unnamed protein product [Caenorhabditis auriculariae]|uniref:Uncharacterized protein n=1 Tax=Caenorhabditis auriculariae TaxID=2777116 RepID=A0A8S1H656_9PELO|nr:unnamed protein product [Caenorhabditis auriculariae]
MNFVNLMAILAISQPLTAYVHFGGYPKDHRFSEFEILVNNMCGPHPLAQIMQDMIDTGKYDESDKELWESIARKHNSEAEHRNNVAKWSRCRTMVSLGSMGK